MSDKIHICVLFLTFSSMGAEKGLKDKRGNVFYAYLDVIKRKRRELHLFEDVVAVLQNIDPS